MAIDKIVFTAPWEGAPVGLTQKATKGLVYIRGFVLPASPDYTYSVKALKYGRHRKSSPIKPDAGPGASTFPGEGFCFCFGRDGSLREGDKVLAVVEVRDRQGGRKQASTRFTIGPPPGDLVFTDTVTIDTPYDGQTNAGSGSGIFTSNGFWDGSVNAVTGSVSLDTTSVDGVVQDPPVDGYSWTILFDLSNTPALRGVWIGLALSGYNQQGGVLGDPLAGDGLSIIVS
jgi:hypothetical protein